MPSYILREDGTGHIELEDAAGSVLLELQVDVLITVFGKFIVGDVFAPIVLSNVKGIKPRIYIPIQSATVRTKQ